MKHKNIKQQISVATATLLAPVAQADTETPWNYDLSYFGFSEIERVSGIEFIYSPYKVYGPEDKLRWMLSLDILTGASHSGATPTNRNQATARPSGRSLHKTPAGELPLDPIFQDNRFDMSFSRETPLNENWGIAYGLGLSYEYDYKSLDGSMSVKRAFNNKNTVVNFGYGTEFALINPEGGVPIPLADVPERENLANGDTLPRDGHRDYKKVHDFILGATQVIDSRWITQWNYFFQYQEGYLTDPFKILSVIAPEDTGGIERGETVGYVYENRRHFRRRHGLYHESRYHFNDGILKASYRYSRDNWTILSNTLTASYHKFSENNTFWEPSVRFYRQSAADFYRHSLVQGDIPQYASADFRISEFTAYTVGLKYGKRKADKTGWSIKVEYYTQLADGHPDDAIGIQRNYNLHPTLHMLKAHYLMHF